MHNVPGIHETGNGDIHIEDLSKIEGHTNLDIHIKGKRVESVKLRIVENKRFYTQAIRGLSINDIPSLVSRICGTCSISHMTCCIEALEYALGIEPSEQTMVLRNLSMNGTILRDHAMHLYLFCLPDLFKVDSVLDLGKRDLAIVERGLAVKKAANDLTAAVAGRAVHAFYPVVGGFNRAPDKKSVPDVVKKLKAVRDNVFDALDLFLDCDFEFICKARAVAMVNNDFNFVEGKIMTSDGRMIGDDEFFDHLHRVVIPYSQSTGFEFEGKEYMVGAMPRINLNKRNLHKDTKKDAAKYLKPFPSQNVFHNNLAQAIEMLHCIDSSIELLETTDFKQEAPKKPKGKSGVGVGVVEAPRGTLYYELNVKNNIVKDGTLVIPTAQNQVNMERDIRTLVEEKIDEDRHALQHEIEKLIRAYDPCMSCASHFLKINWKKK
jgi:coenzyme F420-reducing hydrogenase alpha subunit